MRPVSAVLAALLSGCCCAGLSGQTPGTEAVPSHPPHTIQDNSFLVEEAYNQEEGIVQHISQFTRDRGTGDWQFTFTQEWPAPDLRHQLSVTLAFSRLAETGARGLGDTALNYRYQLLGDDQARVAIAPRLSLYLPTGSSRRGLGMGDVSGQVDVPVSVLLSDSWIAHFNAGATWTPSARSLVGERASTGAWNLGESVIWIGSPLLDVLVEGVYSRFQTVAGSGRTASNAVCLVSPGIRWAYDFPSGLQIVPGVAVPIGVGPSRGSRQILIYLSFEHPFRKARPAPPPARRDP